MCHTSQSSTWDAVRTACSGVTTSMANKGQTLGVQEGITCVLQNVRLQAENHCYKPLHDCLDGKCRVYLSEVAGQLLVSSKGPG